MLAPLRTKRMAPLSICSHGKKNGSENGKQNLKTFVKYVLWKKHPVISVYYMYLVVDMNY
jgi:hypothetical protein